MAVRGARGAALALGIDRQAGVPMSRQLYQEIRQAILAGRLRPGARLPSTRALAAEAGLARITVVTAFEQLVAEGYLDSRVGSGTRVARALPERPAPRPAPARRAATTPRRTPSRRGGLMLGLALPRRTDALRIAPFRTGLPALEVFPTELWARLVARQWRHAPGALLDYGDPAGHRPLREAIAAHLAEARAVRSEAGQIIVVNGSQQALDLAARVLLDPGDAVWIEDPGYLGARGALGAAGLRLVPVRVDAQGLDVAEGLRREPAARLAYVTPSHQYPTGVTMSLARRLALLGWASERGAWILEDDYDSEYRYRGRPLAALQGLDTGGRVIYVGTFSKVLCPALRLGYLVVPPDLVDAFVAARALADRHAPPVTQAALADFIAEGHFARHLRLTRALYAERQAALVEAARERLAGLLDVTPSEYGMHLVGSLPRGRSDVAAARAAERLGVQATPLSGYAVRTPRPEGLVLGYAGFGVEAIRAAVDRLARALAGSGGATARGRVPRAP